MPDRPFKREGVMTQTSKVAQNDAKELMQMDFFFKRKRKNNSF